MSSAFRKKIIFFVLIVVALLICNIFRNSIRNFIYAKSESLQTSLWEAGRTAAIQRKNLTEENGRLSAQNQALISQLADLESTKKENESLRQALGLGLDKSYSLIKGEAIAKDADKDAIIINVGTKDGVVKGFPVVLSDKILIGKVTDVYDNFSRVSLISSKDSLIDVEIPDSSVSALSRGQGRLSLSLDMIPKGAQVNSGSLILTSAMGGNYPSGFVIGQVKSVKNSDSEAFQRAEVQLPFDLSAISDVFVVKSAQIVIQ